MKTSVLFIGFGQHTRRIQFPYVLRHCKKLNVEQITILDRPSQRAAIEEFLATRIKKSIPTRCYYTREYIEKDLIKRILEEHSVTHVILGTDPEHHTEYLKFLIKNKLNVLMDKPISTVAEASQSKFAARAIFKEFTGLAKLYMNYSESNVVVLSQRRYHPGYLKLRDDLIENYRLLGIVPHYLYLMHSDGQLRVLKEIDYIEYHGFNRGYGKVSHSGYHFIDTLYTYLKYFILAGEIDNYKIECHSMRPSDYSSQLSSRTVAKMFNDEAEDYRAKSTGEIDAYVTIQFRKKNTLVVTARIDMLHSGYSGRRSIIPNTDNLYKGNGRIRHEKHVILQGPVYAGYIDSLQSKQIDLSDNSSILTKPGGEYHFDLTRFYHPSLNQPDIKQDSLDTIMPVSDLGIGRGHQEEARMKCIEDFFNSASNNRRSDISDLADHNFSSMIMSGIYESLASGRSKRGRLQ